MEVSIKNLDEQSADICYLTADAGYFQTDM
jgi:hypothetical protein